MADSRRLYKEELHNLHNLHISSDIKVIKSRRVGWVVHVTRMGEMRNSYKILAAKPYGRDHSEDLSVDGKIILEWTFGK
jgi:hypothetical protein